MGDRMSINIVDMIAQFTRNYDSNGQMCPKNYKKYKDLLLSNIFFDERQFPKVVIDTKKFAYQNEEELEINVELIMKGQSQMVPLTIIVKHLAEELIQIQSELVFSRTDFNIGIGKWSNTTILRDKAKINTNLFLFKE